MKKYENYRESGVEWLGDIPSHWKCVSFKTYFKSNMGAVILQSDLDDNGTIPVYSATQENKFFGYVKSSNVILNKGDIVIPARGNSIGCIKLVNEKSTTTQTTIYSKKINTINNLYVFYYLMGLKTNIFYFVQTAIPQITVKEINEKKILIPPMEEQEEIVNYLDHKVTNIDKLISKKKKQVELLTENRKSIINDLITNGLNPDVDFKDTHMEYVGKIPKHWEFKKLDQMAIQNKVKNDDLQEKNLLSLSYGNIIRKDMNSNLGLLPANFKAYQIVQNGYIVLRLTDLQNDKKSLRVGLAKERGIITSAYIGLIFKSHNSRYIFFYLYVLDIKKVFYNLGAGVRQSLNYSELKNLLIPMPPLEEQEEIVKYLDHKTSIIDELIEKINKSIELLEEYKISLVSHVVTGKMKIRGRKLP